MKREDYLQITNRINHIRTQIEKKHPHPSTLHYNYKRIIQERDDKAAYLSKQSPTLEVLRQLPPNGCSQQRLQVITESRSKIKQFHNDFEELDRCVKVKNKLRAKKVREEEELYMERLAKKIIAKEQPEEERENESDSYSRPEPSRRDCIVNTTSHPFQNAKAEKFLEVYKDYLRKHKQDPKHKFRFPGVGFECTPLYQLIKASKKEKGKENGSSTKLGKSRKHLQSTLDAVYNRKKTLLESNRDSKNRKFSLNTVFESRIRQIKQAESELSVALRPTV